jgi:hypothetical protein
VLEARGIDRLYHVPLLAFKGIEEWFFPRDYPQLLQTFLYEDAALRIAPRAVARMPIVKGKCYEEPATPRFFMRYASSALKPWPLRLRGECREYEYAWPSLEYDSNPMCCERIAKAADDETDRVCIALYGQRFAQRFDAMLQQDYAHDNAKKGDEQQPAAAAASSSQQQQPAAAAASSSGKQQQQQQ